MASVILDEKAIFNVAREIASPEARAEYLRQACGTDASLFERVQVLLDAYEGQASFLESPPVIGGSQTTDQPMVEAPGSVIGPYKLLEQIGEGGFGVVFMAEQTEPVRRKVALKVLKPGMDTKQVLARFEAERQALALMDHANIARVLDGGRTGAGRPYFVMDLVKGVPITDFCDQNHLMPRQRLELFIPVCQAVQHAHQKGIIHRDLKPSNVLVTRHDTTPIVRVIDFGVAKALGQELTDKTLFTGIAQMIGTPLYMSPEQAGMSDLDVDTRSDIYSLGVLLYELLTGTTPFSKERFKQAAYDEIRRIIREEEPPKPSTRLSQLGRSGLPSRTSAAQRSARQAGPTSSLASVAAQRHTEPVKLTRLMRGELDWIVMKALEKDRSRRYETANGLAMDVQRYLADEPVAACPPSPAYRVWKFWRRHRVAITTAAVVAVALVAGSAVSAWQALRATRAEEQARRQRDAATKAASQEKLANALLADLLRAAAPEEIAKNKRVTAGELFHQAVQKFVQHPQFNEDPEVEANLRLTIGNTYYKLGTLPEAESYLRQAVELRADALGSEHPDTLAAAESLADLLCYGLRQFAEAERLSRRTWEARRRLLGPEDPDTLDSLDTYASTLGGQNRLREAEALSRQCWEACTHVLGKDRERTLISQNNLGVILIHQGRWPEAERLLHDCLEIRRGVGTRFDPQAHSDPQVETCAVMNNLAYVLFLLGQFDEAEKLLREALPIVLRSHGEEHPATLHLSHMLARVLLDKGRPDQAEPFAREALTLRRKVLEPGHENIGRSLLVLGRLLVETNRAAEAEPMLREADKLFRERYPAMQDLRGEAECRLGACLVTLKRYPEAETLLLAGWEKTEADAGVPTRQKQQVLGTLVKLYDAWDRKAQAAAWEKKLEAQKDADKKAEKRP
jgi:serine/threonine protein kinase/tetratricopeptide (TPR) repeat protein